MPNFELVTELSTLVRRDFSLASDSILSPNDANPLVDGEWLELDSNYKLARGTGEGASALVFPVHTERGRYDTQALRKANVLYLGMYEAETTVLTMGSLAVGDALTVQDVTFGGLTKRGLAEKVAATGVTVVGFVSKVVSATKIRFVHFGNQKVF